MSSKMLVPELAGKIIYLASRSPRRRNILQVLGVSFECLASSFPENLDKRAYENRPQDYVVDNASAKAAEVRQRLEMNNQRFDLLIGCDTVVVLDGKIIEKPTDAANAVEMLTRLSDRKHDVYTGVTLLAHKADGRCVENRFYERTSVTFSKLTDGLIERYVATGEPLDKAGGYGIQDSGAILVDSIEGCFYNVCGFPLHRFCCKVRELFSS